jgi:hypothetical protein
MSVEPTTATANAIAETANTARNYLSSELALGMKLEGIFTPHARKQRNDFYDNSKRFLHYS